jgi:predicted DCC family thiol-disulfide oxidoreductase YuxK
VQHAPYDYRADPAVPRFADDRPVIIFDGKCVLCSSFAQFILRKDRSARFRLLAAQSDLGNALYRHFGLDPMSYETYVLLQEGKAYFRSEASIRILDGLGGAWSLFATLARLVPASLRDALYDVIARNRLRWFGTREQCYLPGPSQADRFLS